MNQFDPKIVSQRLISLVHRCLDADLYKTALFYAERLFAMDGTNHDSRHLLSNVLLKMEQPHSALHLVTRPQDEPCSGCYLTSARCNEALLRPQKAREMTLKALEILQNSDSNQLVFRPSHVVSETPDLGVLHCKAGMMAAKASQRQEAIDSFTYALSLDPFLWEAWLGLCNLGAKVNIDEILKVPSNLQDVPTAFAKDEGPSALISTSNPIMAKLSQQYAITPTPIGKRGPTRTGAGFFTPQNGASTSTPPRYRHLQHFLDPTRDEHTPLHPQKGASKLLQDQYITHTKDNHQDGKRRRDDDEPATKRARTNVPDRGKAAVHREAIGPSSLGGTRRSTRLLMSNGKQVQRKHLASRDSRRQGRQGSQSYSDTEDTHADDPSLSSGSIAQSPRSDSTENLNGANSSAEQRQGVSAADRYIFDLMRIFAQAQYYLSKYECNAAINCLESLPSAQQMSPTVMITTAKAHYEMVEYVKAERAFLKARKMDPYRIWDMDIYSTLLWHLRRNAALSFLAQELLNINSKSPEAWIAVGNCFSLQKEHSQALTCFQRASEMDPFCAYAYTLRGHESLVTDDVRKALIMFQMALGYDQRHYNAWYGLGSCYLKMGRLPMAQYHFERAAEIHPANAVLLGCLGMVHEKQSRIEEALSLYNVALVACPSNPLVRYRRAKIMMQRGNLKAAEDDLVRLRDLSPSEPNVVLLLGQVYRLLGKASMATRMLTVARDLDPKNAPKLEKLLLGGSTRNRPGGPSGPGGAGAVTAATAATAATTAGTGTGTGTGGRSTAAGGDMSVEGPGSSVDESMDASMEGQ